MGRVRQRLLEILDPPHPALLEAGAGGEMLVARTRLVFWIFISLAPLSAAIAGGRRTPPEVWIALAGVGVAIVYSIIIYLILRNGVKAGGAVGFVTGVLDVTVVTATLAAVAIAGGPIVAIDSKVAWAVYLLGILVTSLRFDMRICLFVGVVTVIEYVALVLWISWEWGIRIDLVVADPPETTSVLLQVARIALMIAATAIAMGIVNRSRQLVVASGTDRLTGLGNRAYFEERFDAELARSARGGHPLILALFDLDHFKQFNDRFGHDAGDRALKHVAELMKEKSRKQDMVARWGGEEIALILPETDLEGGASKSERIRTSLRERTFQLGDGDTRLTVSVGVAEFPSDGEDAETLFAAADRRLLAAKRSGRDRVVSGESEG